MRGEYPTAPAKPSPVSPGPHGPGAAGPIGPGETSPHPGRSPCATPDATGHRTRRPITPRLTAHGPPGLSPPTTAPPGRTRSRRRLLAVVLGPRRTLDDDPARGRGGRRRAGPAGSCTSPSSSPACRSRSTPRCSPGSPSSGDRAAADLIRAHRRADRRLRRSVRRLTLHLLTRSARSPPAARGRPDGLPDSPVGWMPSRRPGRARDRARRGRPVVTAWPHARSGRPPAVRSGAHPCVSAAGDDHAPPGA